MPLLLLLEWRNNGLEKQRDQGKKAIWDRGNNQFKGTEFEVIAYGKWTFSNATED